MENIQAWFEAVRRDLETKLNIYQSLNLSMVRKPVIFTNRDGLWSTRTNPVIRTNEPLTPIPLEYNPAVDDITSEVMTLLRDIEREQKLSSFTVLLFEVVIDRPELLPRSVELHVAFSPAQEPLPDPCCYFNDPSYLHPQPNRSGTLSQPFIAKVRVRQYTFGSGAADSTLSECNPAIVVSENPSTSPETVPHRPRPLTLFTCATCAHNQPLPSQFADIESRLGVELITDLRAKLDQFLNRSWSGSRTSIIFTHEPDRWITEFTPTIVMLTPAPPIPVDYDHEHFNIERDALDFVCETVRRLTTTVLFASAIRLGAEDNLQMHMLFSDTYELIIWYYENRDQLPLASANRPYMRTRRVACEYRQYPGDTNDRSFLKKNFSMSRELQKLKRETSAFEVSWEGGYSRMDDLRPIANRLGSVLRFHLKGMLASFWQQSVENSTVTVIFTNDESIWAQEREPAIELRELPPMPPDYDHNSFDIVQDMVNYIRMYYVRDGEQENPLFVSTLTFGEGDRSQIHFLMSHYDEGARLFYIDCDVLQNEAELTQSGPRFGGLRRGASTSTAGTGETPVKRQRLSEPGTSSSSSPESSKESSRPGPSTRM